METEKIETREEVAAQVAMVRDLENDTLLIPVHSIQSEDLAVLTAFQEICGRCGDSLDIDIVPSPYEDVNCVFLKLTRLGG
jgi:hypothetical protein